MARSPETLVGRTLADRWRVLEYIKAGGQALVYRVERTGDGASVPHIAKVLLEEAATADAVRRQQREAMVGLKLPGHSNLVTVKDQDRDETERVHFIVMHALNGPDLKEWMHGRGGLAPSLDTAITFLAGIAAGVRELHAHGVIHRDLKPANIVLDARANGQLVPTIVDYGIARFLEADSDLTEAGVPRLVTKLWCAPEQLRNPGFEDRTADVYSLGLVAAFLTSGRHPFVNTAGGEGPKRRLDLSAERPEPALAGSLPPGLRHTISRALEYDPARRQADAAEFYAQVIDPAATSRAPGARGARRASASESRGGGQSSAGGRESAPSNGLNRGVSKQKSRDGTSRTMRWVVGVSVVVAAVFAGWKVKTAGDMAGGGPASELGVPVEIALGDGYACFVDIDGRLGCLGENDRGQLGTGHRNEMPWAQQVRIDATVSRVWAAGRMTCALADGDELYCWGEDAPDESGAVVTARVDPVLVAVVADPRRVAVGRKAVCVAAPEGWRCVGREGEPTEEAIREVGVPLRELVIGDRHSCGLSLDMALWCWGENRRGQLGAGTTLTNGPTRVGESQQFDRVSIGGEHTCARERLTGWMCWGANGDGQLGTGFMGEDALEPRVVIDRAGPFDYLRAGAHHTCGVSQSDAEAFCWGSNRAGQLGVGKPDPQRSALPLQVEPSRPFQRLVSSHEALCGITQSGPVLCWGEVPLLGRSHTPIRLNLRSSLTPVERRP